MCYGNYTISLFSLNLLIFGICIFTVSVQCLIDIYNNRIENNNNSDIVFGVLSVISLFMVLVSLCTIKKIDYQSGYALV